MQIDRNHKDGWFWKGYCSNKLQNYEDAIERSLRNKYLIYHAFILVLIKCYKSIQIISKLRATKEGHYIIKKSMNKLYNRKINLI